MKEFLISNPYYLLLMILFGLEPIISALLFSAPFKTRD